MNFLYPRKFVTEFFQLYREKECLWNKKSSSYKNKNVRAQANEELLRKMREINSTATLKTVRTKIEQWRMTYRRQLKRLLKSSQPDHDGPLYTPTVWYFPLLTFLNEEQCPNLVPLIQSLGLPRAEDMDTAQGDSYLWEGGESGDESDGELAASTEPRHRRIMRQLLQMYRDTPCLWRPDHPGYSIARVRGAALRELLKQFQKLYKGANVKQLKKKLVYCRMAYRRELKRMLQAREQDLVYVPKVWYFKELSFLQHQELPELSHLLHKDEVDHEVEVSSDLNTTTLEWANEVKNDIERSDHNIEDCNDAPTDDEETYYPEVHSLSFEALPVPNNVTERIPRPVLEISQVKKFASSSKSRNSSKANTRVNDRRDRFDIAAENIACKLRYMEEEQRICAEKLINDILYFGEMKYLDRHAALIVSEGRMPD